MAAAFVGFQGQKNTEGKGKQASFSNTTVKDKGLGPDLEINSPANRTHVLLDCCRRSLGSIL